MIICDYKKCTGCMACRNVCPVSAIDVGVDETYKAVPKIDEEKCVNCGRCKAVCPAVSGKTYNKAQKCYAATAGTADISACASAGVSAAFCEYVIKNGGFAFGAGYVDGNVSYVCADTLSAAESLKGSKYVECETAYIYNDVKKCLDAGKSVIFTGTPCKVSGLYAVLGKDYENLVTVDLICHGTAPQKFLNDYLDEKKVPKKRTKITFRGTDDYKLKVYDGERLLYSSPAEFDEYYRAYYNNIILRSNCFSCEYATDKNRPADITIGDFWGIDKSTLSIPASGKVSVILTNTDKGEEFLQKIDLPYEERPLSEAVENNRQLKQPAVYNKDREVFLAYYEKGFIKAVNKTCVRRNIRQNKRNYFVEKIKHGIKKVIKI